ncbi:sulfite exporter TauE/SafE family protein [Brachybacterium sp. EF45031]|uniref:sulfite exporter TauE/SafE family protein n=1 Tax=Brachybacterium sillae TaxID=2810536 RepID=UPI00217DEBC5|nr:sulfite exporter TauE/SafE family protein [Brachybacterium sillae]MCS6711132.1 sulfite exporter TauE/SafE family protein [Brachybacterium sillae]
MDILPLLILLVLGTAAGAINAAVGSGSLFTLPVLIALGVPPGTAVRTNTLGILFSTIGSVAGFRREIAADRAGIGPVSILAVIGAMTGACLLLVSPPGALEIVVPILIVAALVLVVFQKRIAAAIRSRQDRSREHRVPPGREVVERHPYRRPALVASMGAASLYGGYFTAAQGVLYMAILSALSGRSLSEVNPVKNWLSLLVNAAAVLVYLVAHLVWGAEILWIASAAIAVGALLGGYFGARLAKKLPDPVLRGAIVVVALVALVRHVL